jgi:TPP-dependent pyruvate/acetoin dehydrogenase alpha subunit
MTKKAGKISTSATEAMDVEHWLHAYQQMAKIRAFEEKVNELYQGAKMPGLAHLYRDRRLLWVFAKRCDRMITSPARTRDTVIVFKGIHRSNVCWCWEGSGLLQGKGGSMHIAIQDLAISGRARLSAERGITTGAAFSAKMRSLGSSLFFR